MSSAGPQRTAVEAAPAERPAASSAAAEAPVTAWAQHNHTGEDMARVLRAAGGRRGEVALALRRACGNRRFGRMLSRLTPGEEATGKARTNWLDPAAAVKTETDVLRAALREIKNGKNVEFNRAAGKARLATALTTLGKAAEVPTVEAEWSWLVDHRGSAGTTAYAAKERAFFGRFDTPLATLSAAHPRAQTVYWLKNTPAAVMDAVIAASDAALPPAQLYSYAAVEGLIDYVRDEIVLAGTDEPTPAQLAGVSTTTPVSGFDYLGADDFWADLNAAREPLSAHLPSGYDLSLLTHDPRVNEQGRTVDSVMFPNLAMGVQALAASVKRRRALFLADVTKFGYAAPTTEELVYWTYVYYNAGEFNGQLEKYRGKRTLSDWITRGEYPNALKLLRSFRMVEAMHLF